MNRKRAVVWTSLATGLAALIGGAYWLLAQQPTFYRASLAPPLAPDERGRQAEQFLKAVLQLRNDIHNNEERWSQEFHEQSINSWLAEELPVKYAGWLPPEVIEPRVKIEKDGVWIAFHTRRGIWSGVVSCRLNVWVAGANELAIEIQSMRAGLIPIPLDETIGSIVASMNESGWRMQWKQSSSGDVLVVSLDDSVSPGGSSEGAVLEAVELVPEKLRVAGCRQSKAVTRTAGHPLPASHAEGGIDGVK